MLSQDIKGSTVGILGVGRIGQVIAKRLKGFEVAKIIYTGNSKKVEGLNKNLCGFRCSKSKWLKVISFETGRDIVAAFVSFDWNITKIEKPDFFIDVFGT